MQPPRPPFIVDIHPHVISDDLARFPITPMGGKQSDWSKERPATAEGMLKAMREAGVAQSALVQASTCYGNDNRYVIASVHEYPRQFAGVCSVDFSATDTIQKIDEYMQAGMSGVRVFVAGHTAADHSIRLDDPHATPIWTHLAEHKIPVCVQLRADKLDQLETVLSRTPDAVVVLDHGARPALEDGPPYAAASPLFALARHPNLYVKYTTHNVRESKLGRATQASFSRALVDRFGAHRIAWGSNFPASPGGLTAHLQEALDAAAELSAEERDFIFSRTARALYPALGAAG